MLRLQWHRAGADGLPHRPENTAMSAVRRQVYSRVRILQRIGHSIQDEEILSPSPLLYRPTASLYLIRDCNSIALFAE